MEAAADLTQAWATGTAFVPPLPVSTHPVLALITLTIGLFFGTKFGISQKPILVNDLATTVSSSVFLGFGLVFLFLAVGLYV